METIKLFDSDLREFSRGRADDLPASLFYGPDAPDCLARALLEETGGRRALVLFDARTRDVAGERCVEVLRSAGWEPSSHLVPDAEDGSSPVCDDRTFEELKESAPDCDALVAVGSGVISDLTKWLAADSGKPYAALATAASMNGYAAANVAPSIDGVKTLQRARAPRIIAAEPGVLAGAPARLTASGLGDVIAKPVSTADWKMNHVIFGEDFSQPIADVIGKVEPLYLEAPEKLAAREQSAIEGLFRALVLSGCAMTLQGSSLPASGGEHLVSHTLDMKAHADEEPHDLHGRQVGVATVFASALYAKLLELESPELRREPLSLDEAYWRGLAPAVQREYVKSVARVDRAAEWLATGNNWDRLRGSLQPLLRSPAKIRDCLRRAGAASCVADIGCTRDSFTAAVRNAPCIRERFTSLSLGFIAGLLPGDLEDLVDEWLV